MSAALTSGGQNFTQQEIDALFNAADVNRDGTVDYEEFITLMCPSAATIVYKFRSQYKSIDDVRAAFKRFDANGDGALSRKELAAALKSSGIPRNFSLPNDTDIKLKPILNIDSVTDQKKK